MITTTNHNILKKCEALCSGVIFELPQSLAGCAHGFHDYGGNQV